MTEYSHCPNCQAELKNTFMANVKLLSPNKTAVINELVALNEHFNHLNAFVLEE